MSAYICNPMNLPYKYNYQKPNMPGLGESVMRVYREAADPTLAYFKGRVYLFPSMTRGFFVSDDMANWEFHELHDPIPVFDYAPDVEPVGEYLVLCASKRSGVCDFYRSKDPCNEPFEVIPGSFAFWDPCLFCDDDGRLYFYWGCSNITPIWGVELDRETMKPIGEKQALFQMDNKSRGYERIGIDHISPKAGIDLEKATEEMFQQLMQMPEEVRLGEGLTTEEAVRALARGFAGDDPYIEGSFMTKYNGKYYLQYACPETQSNVYADAVLVSDGPLGPFTHMKNNPFSYKPGGFICGAGQGSTVPDSLGRYWHVGTMFISKNAEMERRVGLWRAGFDADGEIWCDQRYGDWPRRVDAESFTPPEMMLLSYGKPVTVSSGEGAERITNENARDWWRADAPGKAWCEIDLGSVQSVEAIQVNFADEGLHMDIPEGVKYMAAQELRYIDEGERHTRYLLEGSDSGDTYEVLKDARGDGPNLCHDFFTLPKPRKLRYIRLTVEEMPFDQPATVSGLRIFGHAGGQAPQKPQGVQAERKGDLDMLVSWQPDDATGHVISWGYAADKLYHSYMVFGQNNKNIGALVKGQSVYVRVDAFNGDGIAEGDCLFVE